MKKLGIATLLLTVLIVAATPARADTSLTFGLLDTNQIN